MSIISLTECGSSVPVYAGPFPSSVSVTSPLPFPFPHFFPCLCVHGCPAITSQHLLPKVGQCSCSPSSSSSCAPLPALAKSPPFLCQPSELLSLNASLSVFSNSPLCSFSITFGSNISRCSSSVLASPNNEQNSTTGFVVVCCSLFVPKRVITAAACSISTTRVSSSLVPELWAATTRSSMSLMTIIAFEYSRSLWRSCPESALKSFLTFSNKSWGALI